MFTQVIIRIKRKYTYHYHYSYKNISCFCLFLCSRFNNLNDPISLLDAPWLPTALHKLLRQQRPEVNNVISHRF